MKPAGKYRAFTLIELLTVISVISLLLSISVPAINKVKQKAKGTKCQANLHAVATAFRMYLDEYRDFMPPACRLPSFEDKPGIAEFLEPFLSAPESLECPADSGRKRPDSNEKYFETELSSYEYNARVGGKRIRDFLIQLSGKKKNTVSDEKNLEIVSDYEPFHGEAGKPGAVNYLYADLHIGDLSEQL